MKKPFRHASRLTLEGLEHRDAPTVVPVGGEFRINAATDWAVDEPAVALDGDGDFVVAWQAMNADGSDNAIFVRRHSKDGTALTGDIPVNTFTTGSQQRPAVAADALGNFIVVWGSASAQDGSREGIYARRYDANGQPLSGEFRINQYTLHIQGNASVSMDNDGDFVVTWESAYQDGSGYGIYARRYDGNAQPLGDEFLVNANTGGDQRHPSVALSANGSFVISWQSPDQDLEGVFVRRFASNGLPLGADGQVNTFTLNNQSKPRVAADATGNFAVVWESTGQDNGTSGVYLQRFAANGTPLGLESRVNTFTTNDQIAPRIAANGVGDLIVTWQSNGQDGDSGGIYGQRISANGQLDGAEMRINSTTLGDQVRPAVGTDNYGDFVIAWPSFGPIDDGIYAQRYYRPPVPQVEVRIDDGNPQRSAIRDITLSFNTLVNIASDAVQLTGPTGPVSLVIDDLTALNKTTIRLRFQGSGITGGSLNNGDYQLIVHHQMISNSLGELLDGNGDGAFGPDVQVNFHRMFGDANGDRMVTAIDYAAFRLIYGMDSTNPSFRHYFDVDGDNLVSATDFLVFRNAYGTIMLP